MGNALYKANTRKQQGFSEHVHWSLPSSSPAGFHMLKSAAETTLKVLLPAAPGAEICTLLFNFCLAIKQLHPEIVEQSVFAFLIGHSNKAVVLVGF